MTSTVPLSAPGSSSAEHAHPNIDSCGLLPSVALYETNWYLSQDAAKRASPDLPSPRRRAEFAAGRRALREAGQFLNVDLSDIAVAPTGAPVLPRGVAASLTHTGQYVAAVVSIEPRLTVFGIDAEPWEPLDVGTLSYISCEQELAAVAELEDREPRVPWGRILFTAKEAAFKALGHVGVRPRFSETTVFMSGQSIFITYRTHSAEHRLRGRWSHRVAHGTVLTAVWDATLGADWLSVATARP